MSLLSLSTVTVTRQRCQIGIFSIFYLSILCDFEVLLQQIIALDLVMMHMFSPEEKTEKTATRNANRCSQNLWVF